MARTNVVFLIFIAAVYCNSIISAQNPTYDACNDFFDYVCKDISYKRNPKLGKRVEHSKEVQQFQEYVFPNETAQSDIWDEINSERLSYWLLEFSTFFEGVKWKEFRERHERLLNISHIERVKEIESIIGNFESSSFYLFYYGLQKNIINMEKLNLPHCKRNPFYHSLYDSVKDTIITIVEEHSSFSQPTKEMISEKLNETKVYFAYADYNDINIVRKAKTEYEKEYYRLKAAIKPQYFENPKTDTYILLASIDKSIQVLKEYMSEFSEGFIFQSTIAASSPDAFNYQNEIFISIFTRINPDIKGHIYSDTLFVLAHEVIHAIYNLEEKEDTPDKYIWEQEEMCADKTLRLFSTTDRKPLSEEWSPIPYIHEDLASAEAFRLLMIQCAQRMHNMDQMRQLLENTIKFSCTKMKNRMIPFHNPTGISFNYAVSQIPIFKTLYNCSEGDRMFIKNEEICQSMAIEPTKIDYSVQAVDTKEYPLINTAMNFLEQSADELNHIILEESPIPGNYSSQIDSIESSESSESKSDEDLDEYTNNSEVFDLDEISKEQPYDEYDDVFLAINATDSEPMTSSSAKISIITLCCFVILFL